MLLALSGTIHPSIRLLFKNRTTTVVHACSRQSPHSTYVHNNSISQFTVYGALWQKVRMFRFPSEQNKSVNSIIAGTTTVYAFCNVSMYNTCKVFVRSDFSQKNAMAHCHNVLPEKGCPSLPLSHPPLQPPPPMPTARPAVSAPRAQQPPSTGRSQPPPRAPLTRLMLASFPSETSQPPPATPRSSHSCRHRQHRRGRRCGRFPAPRQERRL